MTEQPLLLTEQSLQAYNTFGIDQSTDQLAEVQTTHGLLKLLEQTGAAPTLLLGGGSNVLLSAPISGLTLVNRIAGIRIEAEKGDQVLVSAGGGTNWHQFVLWTLENGLGGIENLALIPGTVGAAPVQNIGAYGVELADCFEKLEALEWATGHLHQLSHADCQFAYRDSFFKKGGKGKFCITRVWLRLKRRNYQLNTSYGAIQQELAGVRLTPRTIAQAVIRIRQAKLPDWRQVGNAGSFFKNPIVSKEHYLELHATDPNLAAYAQEDGRYKLAAGYLIDRCGWKGKREGAVGTYRRQALVIVNHGGATGAAIVAFSNQIAQSVSERYRVQLEREVRLIE